MKTRLTERFGLEHPIVSAPMALAGGGRLAAAVSQAGGLGLIGGGYGDGDWLAREYEAAGHADVGCGFITWKLREAPELLSAVLARKPKALMLSFDRLEPFAEEIRAAGVPLIAQVQTLAGAVEAVEAGADVLVAQGGEAGGHGATRGTMAFVPEVADMLAARAPDVLLLAAGGIADGRGLAASLMLGADGVLVGSRFWASAEALVPAGFAEAAIAASGDETQRSSLHDIVRGIDWPEPWTIRTLQNAFTQRWADQEGALHAEVEGLRAAYDSAMAEGDAREACAIVGEAVGLIHDLPPAGEIVDRMAREAAQLMGQV